MAGKSRHPQVVEQRCGVPAPRECWSSCWSSLLPRAPQLSPFPHTNLSTKLSVCSYTTSSKTLSRRVRRGLFSCSLLSSLFLGQGMKEPLQVAAFPAHGAGDGSGRGAAAAAGHPPALHVRLPIRAGPGEPGVTGIESPAPEALKGATARGDGAASARAEDKGR